MGKVGWRGLPRVAYFDGNSLHHWSIIVCNENSRKIFPGKAWYLGKNIFNILSFLGQQIIYLVVVSRNKTSDSLSFSFQFHSHQIFHCFVIAGAFVHYHGISLMALYRLQKGDCPMEPVDEQCIIDSIHNSLKYSNHTY